MTSYSDSFNDTVVMQYGDGFPLLMPRWGYVVSAFVLFIIGFFGFFLNLMVILLMFKDRQLWTPLNIILFNLVCSDFSVSVLGNPLTLISALFHRWVFGHTMCVLYGFFMALLGITSITTLTVISFERYLMVTRPLSSRHLSSKGAAVSVIFIWAYSLALTTPPLMGWGNYVNEAANISCSVNWHEQSVNTLTYILFLFAMGQIVPLSVITFSYLNIIRTMKRNSKRLGRVSRAEAKATSMVFIMIVAFTVAWTPYSFFALMEQFANERITSPGAGVIPALVAKSSICYNPLIYVGMNTQFRQSIKRIFGIHSKRGGSQTDKCYNNTMLSPAHKQSSYNEFAVRYSSDTIMSTPRRKDRITVTDDSDNQSISMTLNEVGRHPGKAYDLSTIQENKTVSDAERSGDTMYDEESCTSNKKLDLVFGESCKTIRDPSPIVTMLDSERLLFSREQNSDEKETLDLYSSNLEHRDSIQRDKALIDLIEVKSTKRPIRQSYSLDLGGVLNEGRKRKFSIETKLETFSPSKIFSRDSVMCKLFESESKQRHDSVKSYLCRNDRRVNDDDGIL
ncbi:parapinopsin-like [Maniola hyperantus]|uniref:parapinopsin-like n=1 Tax=Aphantopus hyperantus TaxID=2795564 RepID=UPI001569BE0E|nr:parapinopsin-like [Maniola hyperantus]